MMIKEKQVSLDDISFKNLTPDKVYLVDIARGTVDDVYYCVVNQIIDRAKEDDEYILIEIERSEKNE